MTGPVDFGAGTGLVTFSPTHGLASPTLSTSGAGARAGKVPLPGTGADALPSSPRDGSSSSRALSPKALRARSLGRPPRSAATSPRHESSSSSAGVEMTGTVVSRALTSPGSLGLGRELADNTRSPSLHDVFGATRFTRQWSSGSEEQQERHSPEGMGPARSEASGATPPTSHGHALSARSRSRSRHLSGDELQAQGTPQGQGAVASRGEEGHRAQAQRPVQQTLDLSSPAAGVSHAPLKQRGDSDDEDEGRGRKARRRSVPVMVALAAEGQPAQPQQAGGQPAALPSASPRPPASSNSSVRCLLECGPILSVAVSHSASGEDRLGRDGYRRVSWDLGADGTDRRQGSAPVHLWVKGIASPPSTTAVLCLPEQHLWCAVEGLAVLPPSATSGEQDARSDRYYRDGYDELGWAKVSSSAPAGLAGQPLDPQARGSLLGEAGQDERAVPQMWVRRNASADVKDCLRTGQSVPVATAIAVTTATIRLTATAASRRKGVLAPTPLLDCFPDQRTLISAHQPPLPLATPGRWVSAGTWPTSPVEWTCLWYYEGQAVPGQESVATAALPHASPVPVPQSASKNRDAWTQPSPLPSPKPVPAASPVGRVKPVQSPVGTGQVAAASLQPAQAAGVPAASPQATADTQPAPSGDAAPSAPSPSDPARLRRSVHSANKRRQQWKERAGSRTRRHAPPAAIVQDDTGTAFVAHTQTVPVPAAAPIPPSPQVRSPGPSVAPGPPGPVDGVVLLDLHRATELVGLLDQSRASKLNHSASDESSSSLDSTAASQEPVVQVLARAWVEYGEGGGREKPVVSPSAAVGPEYDWPLQAPGTTVTPGQRSVEYRGIVVRGCAVDLPLHLHPVLGEDGPAPQTSGLSVEAAGLLARLHPAFQQGVSAARVVVTIMAGKDRAGAGAEPAVLGRMSLPLAEVMVGMSSSAKFYDCRHPDTRVYGCSVRLAAHWLPKNGAQLPLAPNATAVGSVATPGSGDGLLPGAARRRFRAITNLVTAVRSQASSPAPKATPALVPLVSPAQDKPAAQPSAIDDAEDGQDAELFYRVDDEEEDDGEEDEDEAGQPRIGRHDTIPLDAPVPLSRPPAMTAKQARALDTARSAYKAAQDKAKASSMGSTNILSLAAALAEVDVLGTGLVQASVLPRLLARAGVRVDAPTVTCLVELCHDLACVDLYKPRTVDPSSLEPVSSLAIHSPVGRAAYVDCTLLCDLVMTKASDVEAEQAGAVAAAIRHRLRLREAAMGLDSKVTDSADGTASVQLPRAVPAPAYAAVPLADLRLAFTRAVHRHMEEQGLAVAAVIGSDHDAALQLHGSTVPGLPYPSALFSSVLPHAPSLPALEVGDGLEAQAGCAVRTRDIVSLATAVGGLLSGPTVPGDVDHSGSSEESAAPLDPARRHVVLATLARAVAHGVVAVAAGTPAHPPSLSSPNTSSLSSPGHDLSPSEDRLRHSLRASSWVMGHLDPQAPFRAVAAELGGAYGTDPAAPAVSSIPWPSLGLPARAVRAVLRDAYGLMVDQGLYQTLVQACRVQDGQVMPSLGHVPDGWEPSVLSAALGQKVQASVPSLPASPHDQLLVSPCLFLRRYLDLQPAEYQDIAHRLAAHAQATAHVHEAAVRAAQSEGRPDLPRPYPDLLLGLMEGMEEAARASAQAGRATDLARGTMPSRFFCRALLDGRLPVTTTEAILLARKFRVRSGGPGQAEPAVVPGAGWPVSHGRFLQLALPAERPAAAPAAPVEAHTVAFLTAVAGPGATVVLPTSLGDGDDDGLYDRVEVVVGPGVQDKGDAPAPVRRHSYTARVYDPRGAGSQGQASAGTTLGRTSREPVVTVGPGQPATTSFPFDHTAGIATEARAKASTVGTLHLGEAQPGKTPSAPSKPVGPPAPLPSDPLSFYQSTGQWTCGECLYSGNVPHSRACELCYAANPWPDVIARQGGQGQDDAADAPHTAALAPVGPMDASLLGLGPANGHVLVPGPLGGEVVGSSQRQSDGASSWTCPACAFPHKAATSPGHMLPASCAMCDWPREVQQQDQPVQAQQPVASPQVKDSQPQAVQAAPTSPKATPVPSKVPGSSPTAPVLSPRPASAHASPSPAALLASLMEPVQGQLADTVVRAVSPLVNGYEAGGSGHTPAPADPWLTSPWVTRTQRPPSTAGEPGWVERLKAQAAATPARSGTPGLADSSGRPPRPSPPTAGSSVEHALGYGHGQSSRPTSPGLSRTPSFFTPGGAGLGSSGMTMAKGSVEQDRQAFRTPMGSPSSGTVNRSSTGLASNGWAGGASGMTAKSRLGDARADHMLRSSDASRMRMGL